MNRREFSRAHKAEMLRRAMDEKGRVFCESCGLDVTGKPIEFDHTIPEALILDKTRPLAVVVISGLLSSTALTLLVLPVLYPYFEEKSVEA